MRFDVQFFDRFGVLALVLSFALPSLAFGTLVVAFDFPQPTIAASTVTGNDAFYFTPTTNIKVEALGMYDHNQDGLTQVHTVGLYEVSSSLLLQSVNVGPGDSFINGVFRFQNIPNTLLLAGTQYAVSGFTVAASNSHAWNPAGIVIAPEIGYNGYAYNYNSLPSLPAGPLDMTSTFFGPNLIFVDNPEPASIILLASGLAMVGLYRRTSMRSDS